jgi:UDP-N-acetylmuramate dehydrogenase
MMIQQILHEYPIGLDTSFGSGGCADNYLTITNLDDIGQLNDQTYPRINVFGGGYNTLVSDKGLRGLTIRSQINTMEWLDTRTIRVGSGCSWDELVVSTISNNLWGLECTSGIPGTVGGAVVGNIAAYGQQVKDTLVSIKVLDLDTLKTRDVPAEDLGLEYRSSILKSKSSWLILTADFCLSKERITQLTYESATKVASDNDWATTTPAETRRVIMEARRLADSLANNQSKNAGSFFKNPIVTATQADMIATYEESERTAKQLANMNLVHGGNSARVSAALVLLAAGFQRGQTFGRVRLNPNHILKIENVGGAKSQEIYDVGMLIVDTVQTKLGITLEPEIKFLGDF